MSLDLLLALTLAVMIGLVLGLLGSGGAIVTLPVLVYVAGIQAQEAVAMSMVIVGSVSFVGMVMRYRRGHMDPKAVIFFALTGIVGAFYGTHLTHLVSPYLLMAIFGILMIIVGSAMLWIPSQTVPAGGSHPLRCAVIGGVVGVLTGFLGIGGGFLIVPALVLFAGIEFNTAVGSSLAIIAINSVSGLFGQLRYTRPNWTLTLAFLGIALIGMVIGTWGSRSIPTRILRRVFAIFILVIAVIILIRNTMA